jgi:hypothetical protein
VLDFVNEREDIHKAFRPYYRETDIGDMSDVHQRTRPTMALALQRHHRARTTARKDPATTGSMMPPVAKPKHKLI